MSKSYKQFSEEAQQLDEFIGKLIDLAGKVVKNTIDGGRKKELGVSKGSDEKGFPKAS